MPTIQVFDPPMCCSTGICGPEVDPTLARFASDLEWLKENGIDVQRFNLGQEPAAFVSNPTVAGAIRGRDDALPLILVNGAIASQGSYPSREVLAELAGIAPPASRPSLYTEAIQELVAIGAAIAANCEPCFKYHFDQARKLGVSKEDVARAVATAQMVKEAPARSILEVAERYTGAKVSPNAAPSACCPPAETAPVGIGGTGSTPKKCC
jgi:AhpD family alkylhydroperoxidase